MKRLLVGLCALGWLAVEAAPALAAWDNVFQATCFGLFRRRHATTQFVPAPVVAQAAPGCCPQPVVAQAPAPCPQQCTTQYVQRCFYQPVTTYQTQTYYEQVTTYKTSYYYEPVTSYRYSCYYDPCTCSYQQVAVPQVSHQLRAQSCPVQSWVQRCCSVPVTTYQKSCYLEPHTTCCQTTVGALIPMNGAAAAPAGVAVPQVQPVPVNPPINMTPAPGGPNVGEQRSFSTPPPPLINEQRNGMPPANGTSLPPGSWHPGGWQPGAGTPSLLRPSSPPPPPVKLDRIAVGADARVEGQVVRSDNTPRPNAQVLFVRADRQGAIQSATANSAGRFNISLSTGGWLVYLTNPDGTQAYHSRIDITGEAPPQIVLTSR